VHPLSQHLETNDASCEPGLTRSRGECASVNQMITASTAMGLETGLYQWAMLKPGGGVPVYDHEVKILQVIPDFPGERFELGTPWERRWG